MDGCHFGEDWLLQSQQPQNHATVTFIHCIRTQLYGPEDLLLSELDLLAPLALVNYTAKTYNKGKKQLQMEDRSWPCSWETAVQITATFHVNMLFRDRLQGKTV